MASSKDSGERHDTEWATVKGSTENPENQFGEEGASINARASTFEAPFDLSFRLHAIFGLYKYPNYLRKWNEKDVDLLIDKLKESLRLAEDEKTLRKKRASVLKLYRPPYPQLRNIEICSSLDKYFVDSVAKIFAKSSTSSSSGVARGKSLATALNVRREAKDIYSFDLFQQSMCASLIDEIRSFLKFRDHHESECGIIPGTVRERLVCRDMGLRPFMDFLFAKIVRPLVKELYDRESMIGHLDFHHAYFVGYGKSEDASRNVIRRALIPHTDDSEITFNVGLSGGYEGGRLFFRGKRNAAPDFEWTRKSADVEGASEDPVLIYKHRPGRALIHLGQHIHEVEPVKSGERHVLIVWCRSIRSHRARTCPCCNKMNRTNCICHPVWN